MMSKRELREFKERTKGLPLALDEFQATFLQVLFEAHTGSQRLSMVEATRRTAFNLKLKEVARFYGKRETDGLEQMGLVIKEKDFKPYTVYLLPGAEKEIAVFLDARRALLAKAALERERHAVGSFISARRMKEQLAPAQTQPAVELRPPTP